MVQQRTFNLLLFLFSFFWLSFPLTAADKFADIPVNGTIYSPADSLKIYFRPEVVPASFQIRLSQSGKVVLDTTFSGSVFSWFIPEHFQQGNYLLGISSQGKGSQDIAIQIVKNHFLQYHYQWQNLTPNAAFYPRDGAGLVKFKGKYWLYGGWHWLHYPTTNNEIFSSTDGINWEFEQNAAWEGRHIAGWAVLQDTLWLVGGDNNRGYYIHDVWKSGDGLNWQKVVDPMPLPHRAVHLVSAFKDKLFLIGGEQIPLWGTTDSTNFADIWSSSDGKNWKLEKDPAEFNVRGIITGQFEFADSLWIVGGGTYEPRQYFNDVWNSADGVNWHRVKENAAFPPRQYHSVNSFDGKLWVMGGYNGELGGDQKDVWYSEDGRNWQELPNTPWNRRHAHSVVSDEKELLMLGGPQERSDVWRLYREIDSLRHSETRDTLFVQKGFKREVYTSKAPGFTYNWFRNDTLVSAQNRILVSQTGTYQLMVQDLGGKQVRSSRIVFSPVPFDILPDTIKIFENDKVSPEAFVNARIHQIDRVTDLSLSSGNETGTPPVLSQIGLLVSRITFETNPALADTAVVRIVKPRIYPEGPLNIYSGETIILSLEHLPGYRYRWYKNGLALTELDSSALAVVQPGTFQVEIYRDTHKIWTSDLIQVSGVNLAFNLPTQIHLLEGDAVEMRVEKYDELQYQWELNGNPLPDSGSNIKAGKPGVYKLRLSRAGLWDWYLPDSIAVTFSRPPLPAERDIVVPYQGKYTLEFPEYFNTDYVLYDNKKLVKTQKAGYWDLIRPGTYSVLIKGNTTQLLFDNIRLVNKAFIISQEADISREDLVLLKGPEFYEAEYRWYRNNIRIQQSDGHRLSTNATGTYQAEVITKSGKVFKSNVLVIDHYPNLFAYSFSNNVLEISHKSDYIGECHIEVFDLNGKRLSEVSGFKNGHVLRLSMPLIPQSSSSIYVIKYTTQKSSLSRKVLLRP